MVLSLGLIALVCGQSTLRPADYVIVQKGDLPFIITAPHGGRLKLAGVPVRTGDGVEKKVGSKKNFTFAFDSNTDKLALTLADEIEKRLGKRPYVVIAKFSRRYIDANRPASDGVESPLAMPIYDAYHGAIQKAKDEILAKWKTGVLFDLHGQGSKKETVFRGTANLKTVNHWLETWGRDSLTGPDGLLGMFAAKGAVLSPANENTKGKENAALNGGWTVRHYGSMDGGNFDAIQFEFGVTYRKEKLDDTAKGLADSIAAFGRKYLKL